MKAFIGTTFRMIDVDGDGLVGQPEFTLNCISRIAVDDVKLIQNAYQNLLNVRNFKNSITYFISIFIFIFFLLQIGRRQTSWRHYA